MRSPTNEDLGMWLAEMGLEEFDVGLQMACLRCAVARGDAKLDPGVRNRYTVTPRPMMNVEHRDGWRAMLLSMERVSGVRAVLRAVIWDEERSIEMAGRLYDMIESTRRRAPVVNRVLAQQSARAYRLSGKESPFAQSSVKRPKS